ncbi:MAG: sensor histidine kinase [Verrucomicrobia bacterium]|nr:sensor histidine kinase [Cytophagales bacterium]
MQQFLQRHRIFFLHFSFWCVYFSFFLYQISSYNKQGQEPDFGKSVVSACLQVGFMMLISYLNYFYLLPRYLVNKNFGRYFLEFSIPFSILITLFIYLKRYQMDGYTFQEKYFYSERFAVQMIWGTLFIVIFVGMLRFAEDWFKLEAVKKEVENEKLIAELRFLKAQINPHFLFNTLNNLYYLAFTQSPNTTEVIAKLSQMMRYMIYDSNHLKVPLSKEIEYMESYISLEKLRLNNQIPVHFTVKGNPEQVMVVPLIFITFLENAFKHGVGNNNPQAWVNISIELHGKACLYTVENSKISVNDKPEKSGVGLQNVQRRLELSYPNQYELCTRDQENSYWVELKLNLN